jgi:hypothetical protein
MHNTINVQSLDLQISLVTSIDQVHQFTHSLALYVQTECLTTPTAITTTWTTTVTLCSDLHTHAVFDRPVEMCTGNPHAEVGFQRVLLAYEASKCQFLHGGPAWQEKKHAGAQKWSAGVRLCGVWCKLVSFDPFTKERNFLGL